MDYLKDRLEPEIAWYDHKSQWNQRWYKGLRIAEFVLAALIPLLSGFATTCKAVPIAIGLIGAAIAVITACLSLYAFEKNWIEYRTVCESLRKEKFMFLTATEPYNGDTPAARLQLLVQRVETLISKENTNWAQYMMKPTDGQPTKE